VHAHEVVPNYLRFCTYMSGKTLAQRGGEAEAFLAAQVTALRFAMGNRDKAIALTKEVTEAKPDDPRAAYIYDEVKRYSAIDPDMPIPTDKLEWMQDLLIKTGNLEKKADLKTLVDDRPLKKAVAKVGK
jgi:ABC-type nitrate/sulfonate/bicarbonate transport system substrate-binding protein